MGHANDSIVVFQLSAMTQSKGVISGSDCDLIPIRKFIIQGPSHVKIIGFVSCGCTHVSWSFLLRNVSFIACLIEYLPTADTGIDRVFYPTQAGKVLLYNKRLQQNLRSFCHSLY